MKTTSQLEYTTEANPNLKEINTKMKINISSYAFKGKVITGGPWRKLDKKGKIFRINVYMKIVKLK